MKTKLYPFIAAIIILYFVIYNCTPDPGIEDCANDSCFYIDTFAANIKNALHGNCMGFSYVIDYKGTRLRSGADGLMRTARDGGNLAYNLDAKNQIASMSKTLTAIAVLQLLKQNGLTTYTKIQNYLPTAWTIGPNIDKITFRDLLRHESGIRSTATTGCNGEWYDNCSCKVKEGVLAVNMGPPQSYNNMNYSLLRIIIPRLAGFLPQPYGNDTSTANKYIRYVRQNVLDPCTMAGVVGCTEDTSLHYYTWPYFNSRGHRLGDNTLVAGARGWYMSAPDCGNVIKTLFNTEALLNNAWRDTLKANNLGCFNYGGAKGNYLWHNGFTGLTDILGPGDTAKGMVNTCWMYYTNGIDVVCMVNSDIPTWFPAILATAYENAWKHK